MEGIILAIEREMIDNNGNMDFLTKLRRDFVFKDDIHHFDLWVKWYKHINGPENEPSKFMIWGFIASKIFIYGDNDPT